MSPDRVTPPRFRPVLAVTLVSGASSAAVNAVAQRLAGPGTSTAVAPEQLEFAGDDGDAAALALGLADALDADARATGSGQRVIAIEPGVDVLEAALMLEHLLESREPHLIPIAVRDVVAVTTSADIDRLLFGCPPERPDGGDGRIHANNRSHGEPHDAAERLASRLEASSLIVLHDLPTRRVLALLERLCPAARVLGRDALDAVHAAPARLERRLVHRIAASMGWQRELDPSARGRASGSPVQTLVFTDPRPFHPERLARTVERFTPGEVGRIVRSRGLTRLASRPGVVGSWSSAGELLSLDPTSMPSWHASAPLGQELVFFGEGMRVERLIGLLDEALLDPGELLAGPEL
ncbi:cobalamin biosynthesis protein CobW [Herbiconiux sp. VKM Ac-1786]|uniref:GTP-binding protein n=1 Tax=Herbiconiux sp. VKM Ac-1786 TaxID=2783824 RepID=UPI00188A0796|nr:GTP-binding protein [Herbiconiux sp. VKM Ac-1786]MBF4572632.1 cobalamin biosynthesis protein CobW [Herbiconiux sp. VKM Ac-1786]